VSGAALVVVDLQNDFLPGGALAVAGGDEIVAPIAALVCAGTWRLVVATQDWHPRGHVSFASSHAHARPFDTTELYGREQVLWPDHCVAGTRGAELCAGVPWERARAIVRKGTDAAVDSYSGFFDNRNAAGERPATGLGGYLRDCGVAAVSVCGLARDFCVRWTALDGAALGFSTTVLWDLTRSVEPALDGELAAVLRARGVAIRDGAAPI
jgi:nicotinamidase/pyrazinamidase